jgi:hypothetical protein
MLLERSTASVPEAIERLVGLQAQVPTTPRPGLAARIHDASALPDLLARREVVRAPLMRSTMHLFTAADFRRFRRTLQPALVRGLRGFFGPRAQPLDFDRIEADTREILAESPLAPGALRDRLMERHAGEDPAAVIYAARCVTPIAQDGAGTYSVLEVDEEERTAELVRRYLAAFGPATVKDFQAWAGMTGAKPHFTGDLEEIAPGLFDLPGAPRPPADTPAPPRLLPEYDNLVLSHADRTRVLAEEHRGKVSLPAGRVRGVLLIDGLVAGTWKGETLEPFGRLSPGDRRALEEERARLSGA